MCIYCGIPGCRTRSCPAAAEDVSAGLIRRDAFERIILPGGGEPPRSLPGNCMRDRVRAWHDQNPGQKAQGALGHMLYTVASNVVEDCSERTLDEEREVLEQRLAMVNDRLDAKRRAQRMVFDGVEIPARQRHNPRTQGAPAQREVPPHLPNGAKEAPRAADSAPAANTGSQLHPYAQARDTTNTGDPLARDFAYGPGRKPQGTADPASRKEPAYTHAAPVTDAAADERVFK